MIDEYTEERKGEGRILRSAERDRAKKRHQVCKIQQKPAAFEIVNAA